MFTTPVYNSRRRGRFVNSAFLTRNILPKKRSFLWQTKLKESVWRNSTFQVNRTNATGKRRLNSSNWVAMSTLQRKKDTTNLSGYKLGELTENKKKKFYFSSQLRKQFKILTVLFEPLRPSSEVIILRIDLVTIFDAI